MLIDQISNPKIALKNNKILKNVAPDGYHIFDRKVLEVLGVQTLVRSDVISNIHFIVAFV